MLHETWKENHVIKKVEVVHTDAEKFKVSDMLTVGKVYDVVNETISTLMTAHAITDNCKSNITFIFKYSYKILIAFTYSTNT